VQTDPRTVRARRSPGPERPRRVLALEELENRTLPSPLDPRAILVGESAFISSYDPTTSTSTFEPGRILAVVPSLPPTTVLTGATDGDRFQSVAALPDGRVAFLGTYGGAEGAFLSDSNIGAVTPLATDTDSSGSSTANSLAVGPGGTILVGEWQGTSSPGKILAIDPDTGISIPLLAGVREHDQFVSVAALPDGRVAFVGTYGGADGAFLFDPGSGAVTPLATDPSGFSLITSIAAGADGNVLIGERDTFTSSGDYVSGKILAIDPGTGDATTVLAGGTTYAHDQFLRVAALTGGRVAFVGTLAGDDGAFMYDPVTGSVINLHADTNAFGQSTALSVAAVSGPDIKMESVRFGSQASASAPAELNFTFTVTGELSDPFQVQAYRSPTATYDPATAIRLGEPVTEDGGMSTPGEHTDTLTLPAESSDPADPYVILVADPQHLSQDPIRGNNASVLSLVVPYFNQVTGPWGAIDYLNAVSTGIKDHHSDGTSLAVGAPLLIMDSGCTLSDLAMALTYAGVPQDPGTLNQLLMNTANQQQNLQSGLNPGFVGNGDLLPETVTAIAAKNAGRPTVLFRDLGFSPVDPARSLATILETQHVPVLVTVAGSHGAHYVLVTGYDGQDQDYGASNFTILDPGHKDRTVLSAYSSFTIRGYIKDPVADLSSFLAAVDADGDGANLLVTDAQGRRTGYDPATGQILTEIPGSSYNADEFELDPDGTPSGTTLHSVYIFQPATGEYTIQVLPSGSGSAQLRLEGTSTSGDVTPGVQQNLALTTGTSTLLSATFDTGGLAAFLAQTSSVPPSNSSPPPTASVSFAFGPNGALFEVVGPDGILTQYDAAGAHLIGGGVRVASVAFDPAGREVLLVTFLDGSLYQFDAAGAHALGSGYRAASVAFGPGGEFAELVTTDGTWIEVGSGGAAVLATGIRSASVAFVPGGEFFDVVTADGTLLVGSSFGVAALGGVVDASVASGPEGFELALIDPSGELVEYGAFGARVLGKVF
jgi:hypothetical protein